MPGVPGDLWTAPKTPQLYQLLQELITRLGVQPHGRALT